MANNVQGPTLYGKPVGRVGAFFQGTDPRYNAVPTREGYQQASQLATILPTLAKLQFGFGAPSISPIAKEASRQFQQETLPGLMEQFAGHGSQGALTRGIQGAGSDLMTKLASLQQQQQFELQKQRQEQLPRLLELGLSPSFQPVLTDKPIQGLPSLVSEDVKQNPKVQDFLAQAKGAGEDVLGLGTEGLRQARKIPRGALGVGKELAGDIGQGAEQLQQYLTPKIKAQFPEFYKRLEDFVNKSQQVGGRYKKAYEEAALLPGERPAGPLTPQQKKERQKEFESRREIDKLVQKANLDPKLAAAIKPEHYPMIKSLLKRVRGRKELAQLTNPEDIENLYEYWKKHPAKRTKIKDFFRGLVGKKRRKGE